VALRWCCVSPPNPASGPPWRSSGEPPLKNSARVWRLGSPLSQVPVPSLEEQVPCPLSSRLPHRAVCHLSVVRSGWRWARPRRPSCVPSRTAAGGRRPRPP